MANIKTAISLQEPLFDQVETLAREMKVSRSRLFALALEEFIRHHRNQRLLEKINRLHKFQDVLVSLGYRPAFEGATKKFRTTRENVPLEIVTTGEYPGDGQPKPVQFHDPKDDFVVIEGIKTVTLEKLIELKLASGISAPDRLRDLADVQDLIRLKELGTELAEKLNPYVREKFLELHRAVSSARS